MPDHDVIIVGGGGSGLAAACAAAEAGGRVLLLEKQPQLGGTTGIAVGSFTAAGTTLQKRAGITDDPDDHAADAAKFATPEIEACNNSPLRRFFLRESAATFEWLQRLGLSFYGPSPEPPNRVPRMHNVIPGAKAYITALQLHLQRLGGTTLCNCAVTDLVREADRVTGVRVEHDGVTRTFLARRGVILAAGDYAASSDLIARHKGDAYRRIEGINPHATGDGHGLAAAAGAALVNMDITYGPELRLISPAARPFQQLLPAAPRLARVLGALVRLVPKPIIHALIKRLLVTWQHPENALFDDGAILVNLNGDRFTNECVWPDREIAVAAQPDRQAFILLDGRLIDRYSAWPHFVSTAPDIAYAYVRDYQRLRPDVTATADTLETLAARRTIDAAGLTATIDTYNRYVAGRGPDPFGRTGDALPLRRPPWLLLGPIKAYFTTTEGGVCVNEHLQALDEAGRIIPGLYAVGQNGLGGMILWSHGLHIAWAITSGRLAGRSAMEGLPSQQVTP